MSGDLESGESALQLADEAYRRFDVDAVVAHLSAAIRSFTSAGDSCRAALACVRLGDTFANGLGNLTAARAWFARARRLVEDQPPCLEQGWVAVAAMGCDVDDPAELLASAELALDRARRFGDLNLETKALADAGLAHVQAGRVAQGMALLDEAMALACGPADDPDSAAKSVCSFFTACHYAADFARAASWAGVLRQHGLIGPAPGPPVFLASHCDSVQATLLIELGRWGEADALLTRASADFEAAMSMPSWHPAIALADLRTRQGRFSEAEVLLLGKEQALQAVLPAARLHLARGDNELARATARRGLRVVRGDRLRAIELLAVLVDAELASGDLAAARAYVTEMVGRTGDLDVPTAQARCAGARARVLAADGDLVGAVAAIEDGLDRLERAQLPWLRALLLVDLAELRVRTDDPTGAALDAHEASAVLAALDVVVPAEVTALFERLGVRPTSGPADVAPIEVQLTRNGKWWVVSSPDSTVRVPDTKGMRYLAELVAAPGVERHALDLVDRIEGEAGDTASRRALGDAGVAADFAARSAYRHRIEGLRTEIDEALELGRLEAAEALQSELDELVGHLSAAFGMGGRERPAASAAERARLNVTRALRTAIGRVGELVPEAGAVLDRRVRTGIYCAYEPLADDAVRWRCTR
ncbi:MAG: hypothetical protein AVDCRST_MAG50-679 [uncultured Acidimicrobiales bacterium]|uniref:MalT-like TPR region domain-containing protein n=1 Tax=uncultured Acidimicrobiales bacterium TaxID=310071 RepID=A0A6J4HJ89_9ACTN|nr:MAG: hypothetical protein AVDCRST_MAG50-679 [uncultured Acidimicrobiales bacterium]